MFIIPAIDIVNNRAAVLYQGRIDRVKYFDNPLSWLRIFALKNAPIVHVIDIEAAMGIRENSIVETLIREGLDLGLKINVGGGIRSYQKASRLLEIGADKIIIGSLVYTNTSVFKEIFRDYGSERVIVALDIYKGKPVIEGWRKTLSERIENIFEFLENLGVKYVLVTNVERDGTLKGFSSNVPCLWFSSFNVIVAGGIAGMDDLKEVCKTGAWGAIIGRAIYERKISLDDLSSIGWVIKC